MFIYVDGLMELNIVQWASNVTPIYLLTFIEQKINYSILKWLKFNYSLSVREWLNLNFELTWIG